MKDKKILFVLSGSIACFKACSLISALVKSGAQVQPCATKNALNFIGQATLEGLTHRKLYFDMFTSDTYLKHIELNKWADITLLCPASANIINKTAAGIADDFVSTLLAAHDYKKPFFIAPAMNVNLYRNPATLKNVQTLEDRGVIFIGPQKGQLACGDCDEGRMEEPEKILAFLKERL